MNKKGFTLIELLTVIVILAMLSILIISNIIRILDDSREKAYEFLIEEMEVAASIYINNNQHLLEVLDVINPVISVELNQLIGINYLKEPLIDPRTNEELPLTKKVYIILEGTNIIYCYEDKECF